MEQFLVKDFSDYNHGLGEVEYRVVTLKDLFILLEEAKNNDKLKISVYEVGDCLLDWS